MTSALTPAEILEALSRKYSRDTFLIRRLTSGRWCVYDADRSPLGCADTLEGIALLAQPLEAIASGARAAFEAEQAALRRRAEARAEIEALDLSNLDLGI